MSFLKEIITKLESLPNSESIIEKIMALVDGDIEKELDISVMQEITKIIEEETGVSAEEAMAEGEEYPGDVLINGPGPELFTEEASEETSDTLEKDFSGYEDTTDTEVNPEFVQEYGEDLDSIIDGIEEEATSDGEEQPALPDEPITDEEDKLYKQAIHLIKKMLDDKGHSYTETKKAENMYLIEFQVRYDYCRLNAEIYIEKDPLVCFIRITLPISCDPVYLSVLSEHLANLNRKSSRYGTYAIDFGDGSVECRFRLRYDDGLGIKAFQKMLFFSLGDADDEYPEISRISAGKLKKDKREETVKKARALIADIESE